MESRRRRLIAIDWNSNELPTFPTVAYKLLAMVDDDRVGAADMAKLVEQDPSLALKLLKAVNSAFYALKAEVTSVRQAIVLLGMNEVRRIAIGSLLSERFFAVPSTVRRYAEALWRHTLATAILAQDFVSSGEDEPDPYTLGLLHDLGWLLLMVQGPDIFKAIAQEEDRTRQELEPAWGVDHQLWGAKLAERWELPEPFQVVAMHHHQPAIAMDPPRYLCIVHVANYLATVAGFNFLTTPLEPVAQEALDKLGIDGETLAEMEEGAWQERERIIAFCNSIR